MDSRGARSARAAAASRGLKSDEDGSVLELTVPAGAISKECGAGFSFIQGVYSPAEFGFESTLDRLVEAVVRTEAVRKQRPLGKRAEGVGELECCLHAGSIRDDAGSESDLQCLGGVDGATGEDEVEGTPEPDDPRKPEGASIDERNTPAATEHSQNSALFDDSKITPCSELEAAGDGMASDGCNHRLAGEHSSRAHGAVAFCGEMVGLTCGDSLKIRPGAEGPTRAGEDRDPKGVVRVEGAKPICELGGCPSIDGVSAFRTIDGQQEGATKFLGPHSHSGRMGWKLTAGSVPSLMV